jgi:hypothetical protein
MRLTSRAALTTCIALSGALMLTVGRTEAADPCSLLTPEQVASALGVPAVKASGGPNRCMWVPTKYAPGSKSVTLQLETETGFAAQRARPDVTPVKGIGDDAVLSVKPTPVLTVKKGTTCFALAVHLPEDEAKAAEQSLAKQIISKL